jgi:hypothetical protein
MILNEGGNVFKDAQGNPLTGRINRVDVAPTVKWLERITGLSLLDNMLGSTGVKESSGDIDLAIDANSITKEAVIEVLTNWCQGHNTDPRTSIRKTGNSVHFKTPINGNVDNGYVQTDFMFLTDMRLSKFVLGAMPAESQFKGVDRFILINSIGKALGLKLDGNRGLMSRMTNELVSNDPHEMAQILLGPRANVKDLSSVESIVAALKNDPQRDAKLADAKATFEKNGKPLPQMEASVHPTEWFKHLSNRLK